MLLCCGCSLAECCRFMCFCATQIEEQLGLAVPFTAVFEYPTVRQLAAHVLHLLNAPQMAASGAAPDQATSASLAALADAAAARREPGCSGSAGSILLSAADKAAGVACSPAQMYFVTLQQVCG